MSPSSASGRGSSESRTVVVRAADGRVIARRVTVARGFARRLVGLMGRAKLEPEEGLWLVPCNSVHMFFMRTPLDIAYLDRQLRVVHCVPEMRAWRVRLLPVRHAHSTLELAPGTLGRKGITVGEELKIGPEPETPAVAVPSMAGASLPEFSPTVRSTK
ncbi:MAG TPA: DUF192 domain-containing protein [Candidatus Micrarchaeaceae archaeon]|nr:DUF192 domain-containing protein [Candidatus Micrarchaeaceae archaeon]